MKLKATKIGPWTRLRDFTLYQAFYWVEKKKKKNNHTKSAKFLFSESAMNIKRMMLNFFSVFIDFFDISSIS